MKRNSYIIGALAATLAFASCQQDDLDTAFSNDPAAVRINASVGEGIVISRSNPVGDAAAQKVFNAGDQIGVSAGTQGVVKYTLTNDTWTPERGKYLKWETNEMDFTAYYPVGENPDFSEGIEGKANLTTDAHNFALPEEQDTPEKIAAADYMTVVNEPIAKPDGSVAINLTLERRTARIIVRISGFGQQYDEAEKYVKDLYICSHVVAYKDGQVVTRSNASIGIIPYSVKANTTDSYYASSSTFTALILPDGAQPDAKFIALKDATGNDLFVTGIPAHEEGKSYTYDITVGKNGLTIGNVTVEDWGSEEVIPGGEAAEVPFGDTNFAAVLTATPHNIPVNPATGYIDPTDETTLEALKKITTLDVSNKGITSLKGIEYLTGLTRLTCDNNPITALDVSKNTKLIQLYCNFSSLGALDVTQNMELTHLSCNSNSLTSLDVTQNTALVVLGCNSNSLGSLDVTQNKELTLLDCSSTSLTSLDVTQNTALTQLYCSGNSLGSLNVTQNTALTHLYCFFSSLTALDVTQNTELIQLYCNGNSLAALDVSKNTKLARLYCSDNHLTALDITPITATLTLLLCGDQKNDNGALRTITLTLTEAQKTKIEELGNYGTEVDFNVQTN